jgi:hypothetical protein
LALPAALLLARADAFLGWHMDEEEILLFPTEPYYEGYSSVARTGREVAFNPLARHGNVVGNRLLLVSQLTLPVLIDPGPPRRYAELGSAIPAVLGRLHAQVVTNTLTLDGTPAPAWMQLGLMSLSNLAVVANDPTNEPTPQNLRNLAAVGGLLAPAQFENADLGADRNSFVETQARRLMLYFYQRYGAGAAVETLQRLGSGESVDDALTATTGLTEAQFFVAWRDAEFGRPVPGM